MTFSRRQLFSAASAAVCCVSGLSNLTAADPPKRTGSPLLKLSLAGYSFNSMFAKRGTPDEIAKAEMNIEKFIEYCAAQGLGATELTGY